MDGVGIGDGGEGDAVARAHTPTLDWLRTLPSYRELAAHGRAVGMPSDKDMGNSEVGHNALGAGRIFDQGAALVRDAIASGSIFEGEVWKELVGRVRDSGEALHFLGLLSDGNVHSHIDHLLAMLERAAADGVARVRVHALLDGRDVPARSALAYVDRLEAELARLSTDGRDYRVASGGGRMRITMDRYEADWAMVERGWQVHVRGEGRRFASLREAVETLYAESERGDQDLDGFVIADAQGPVGPIRDGAAVIFFNFRGDRALEISRAFEDEEFHGFDRGPRPNVAYAGMMEYDGDLHIPKRYLVDPPAIDDTMGELLAAAGKSQLAIAETQKFGHVTYFWNGNRSGAFDDALERYVEVPSDTRPFEERPWMKAAEVTDSLIAALDERAWDLVRVNYANGDMVGHTGKLDASIYAVEAVDLCLTRLVEQTRARGGVLVVTADHGNADQMFDGAGEARTVRTSHSLNPVPFVIYDPRLDASGPTLREVENAGLANVAATVLELLGFTPPADYCPSLLAEEG
jgi:2,3-bisphosphoglycerate-independent phosphoglycerate mutase